MKALKALLLSIIGASLLFIGCHKEQTEAGNAKVKVHINDFSVEQEEFSGAKDAIVDYSGVNAVTLAFYTTAGTEQYKVTQLRNDASTYTTFGEFECALPMGSYTMVVVAYKTQGDSPFELTGPTAAAFTGAHAFETFATTQAVNITSTSDVNLNATLSRIVAKLQVLSTDGKTANATNVRMTFAAGGKSFNPATGLATSNTGFANTVSISAATGSTSNSISYLFLATDEQTMDVAIDVLDSDGNSISHREVSDVPFKRNRLTKLTGSLYSTDAGSTFQLSTAWLSDTTITF